MSSFGATGIDAAPEPGSPADFQKQNLRLPQHLQLMITNRIDLAVDEASSNMAVRTAIVKRATQDIVELVATYVDGREISMISGLNSAAYHIGRIQRSITERRK